MQVIGEAVLSMDPEQCDRVSVDRSRHHDPWAPSRAPGNLHAACPSGRTA